MSSDIEARIRKVLDAEIGDIVPADQIGLEENLGECGLTSNNYIKVIVKIENEFGIEVADEDLTIDNFMTISRMIAYIEKKL
ncbi:MAG: phosphopantetheine-binding protein [Clostridia bacterium]|nr:phosphopantetheine-binding protein [Clostridia bacterium]